VKAKVVAVPQGGALGDAAAVAVDAGVLAHDEHTGGFGIHGNNWRVQLKASAVTRAIEERPAAKAWDAYVVLSLDGGRSFAALNAQAPFRLLSP
jgi:hypothetical protein